MQYLGVTSVWWSQDRVLRTRVRVLTTQDTGLRSQDRVMRTHDGIQSSESLRIELPKSRDRVLRTQSKILRQESLRHSPDIAEHKRASRAEIIYSWFVVARSTRLLTSTTCQQSDHHPD